MMAVGAIGKAFTVTTNAFDVKEQPLLFETVTEYEPAVVAV